jgi:FSR family fosmidomycin resistance protein-like MFS transporter
MEQAQKRTLIGVSIGHAAHDAWFGIAPILLAAVSAQMEMSNADIGLMLLLYQGISSFVQPLFGRLSERIGGRALAVGAILWTTLMFSIALFAPSKLGIAVCIALAGLGSGAWHPQGAANATIAGGARWGATAASIFFLGGTLGTSILGSALGGFLLGAYGRPAVLLVSALTVILALTVVRATVPVKLQTQGRHAQHADRGANGTSNGRFGMILAFLLLGIAFRSLANMSLSTYVPKQQQDLGVSPVTYGLLMSAFSFATAIGGLAGSNLADRVGLRRVLVGSIVLAAAALWAYTRFEGLASYAALALTGFFVGPSHTLFIVAGQRQFPRRMAMMTGIFLGFTFFSGAGGAWILGLLADQVGSLNAVFAWLPWSMLIAAVFAILAVPDAAKARQARAIDVEGA